MPPRKSPPAPATHTCLGRRQRSKQLRGATGVSSLPIQGEEGGGAEQMRAPLAQLPWGALTVFKVCRLVLDQDWSKKLRVVPRRTLMPAAKVKSMALSSKGRRKPVPARVMEAGAEPWMTPAMPWRT